MNKLFYYDIETTGFSHHKNAIHQIAAIIEIKGKIKEKIDIRLRPFDGAEIEPAALEVGRVTEQIIQGYPEPEKGFKILTKTLRKYFKKPYDKQLFERIGFCNHRFDDRFFTILFSRYGDDLSGYFQGTIDVHPLVKSYFCRNFISTDNMKLHSVAKTLGIEVNNDKLHDASYDVELTRSIHKIIIPNETATNNSKKRA